MSRHWGITLAATAALLTACGTVEGQPVAQSPQTTSGSAAPSDTPANTTKPTSAPAKLTAACPLVPAEDLTRLLNNGKPGSTLTPTEGTPEDDDGGKIYKCSYGKGSTVALELVAREFPAQGRTAASSIDAVAKNSKAKTTNVPGVGEAAVFYPTADGTSVVLAGAKLSGETLRMVVLAGPKVLPQDRLANVAAFALDRL